MWRSTDESGNTARQDACSTVLTNVGNDVVGAVNVVVLLDPGGYHPNDLQWWHTHSSSGSVVCYSVRIWRQPLAAQDGCAWQRTIKSRLFPFSIDVCPYLPADWIDAFVTKYVTCAMKPRAVDQYVTVHAVWLAAALIKQQRPQVRPVSDCDF